MQRRRTLLSLVSASALSTLLLQPRLEAQSNDAVVQYQETTIESSVSSTCVEGGTAWGRSLASVTGYANYAGHTHHQTPTSCNQLLTDSDSQTDPGTYGYASTLATASTLAMTCGQISGASAATTSAYPGYAYTHVSKRSASAYFDLESVEEDECISWYAGMDYHTPSNQAVSRTTFDVVDNCSPEITVTLGYWQSGERAVSWLGGGGYYSFQTSAELRETVEFTEARIVFNRSGAGPQTVVKHGLIARQYVPNDDEKHVWLGSLIDSVTEETFTGSLNVPVTIPSGTITSVEVDVLTDSFANHTGDINADGEVCEDDYDLIEDLESAGSEIDEPGYTPRADFDLDGDVDGDDVTAFETIYTGPC